MTHTKRFDGKGELYAKARPKYAASLFTYMRDTLRVPADGVFADIGSGTGIFTEQLLSCGYTVYAVEPNRDMRIKAEQKLSHNGRFHSVDGTDAHTGLPARTFDCITAAQAFHWFDAPSFRNECRRLLNPNGRVFIVYNSRDEAAPCTVALAALRKAYAPDFHGFSNGISDEKCRTFFGGACDVFRADNSQVYDRQRYVDRVLSSSYSLREDDPRFSEYLTEIHRLFDTYAVHGTLTVPAATVAYSGTVL